ncbi:hypothetical protein [Steroidobacter cummioxidans]|uniref:hypothetical protein n=1 Tax=Steroidobacter cummioxidans TaxID=1803913 RepID=UPI000E323986|nr:hypothetical protein [Steroidobacter cummioxidans]
MLKAILFGAVTATVLAYASIALHEHGAYQGTASAWLTVVSTPILTIASLLPGFVAGWLAGKRGMLAGFLASLLGNIVYSGVFGTFWSSVLEDGMSGVFHSALWLCFTAVSWGVYGAASGAAGQLLRSNKALRDGARNVVCNEA